MVDNEGVFIFHYDTLGDISQDYFLEVELMAEIIDKSIFLEIQHVCNFFCSFSILELQKEMSTLIDHLILNFLFRQFFMQEIS